MELFLWNQEDNAKQLRRRKIRGGILFLKLKKIGGCNHN